MSEELVEKVAERIWDETSGVFTGQWEEQGDFKKARVREMAAAAIPVVLDAVREQVEGRKIRLGSLDDHVIRAVADPFNDGIRAALSSIDSLGAEGGSPE